jgi:ribosomal protein S1
MSSSITNPSVPASPATQAEIVITVKDGQIVTGKVAKVKNHPAKGILVVIEGQPMSFMPNGCVAGKNDAEKAARRAVLIATPGTELQVAIMGEPTVEADKSGKMVGRIKVSEQRAVMAAEKATRDSRNAERNAALEAAVSSLVSGTIVKGAVKGVASKDSDREPGTKYVFGLYVEVAPGVSGLLHVKEIEGGHRAVDAIVAKGSAEVEILSAEIVDGKPRVQLSQRSVGQKAFFDQYPVGAKVKGEIVKVGEQAGNLHGRIIRLPSGTNVFLCDDDSNVKSESALARGNQTRVIITDEVVGGMVRVTRRGV